MVRFQEWGTRDCLLPLLPQFYVSGYFEYGTFNSSIYLFAMLNKTRMRHFTNSVVLSKRHFVKHVMRRLYVRCKQTFRLGRHLVLQPCTSRSSRHHIIRGHLEQLFPQNVRHYFNAPTTGVSRPVYKTVGVTQKERSKPKCIVAKLSSG